MFWWYAACAWPTQSGTGTRVSASFSLGATFGFMSAQPTM